MDLIVYIFQINFYSGMLKRLIHLCWTKYISYICRIWYSETKLNNSIGKMKLIDLFAQLLSNINKPATLHVSYAIYIYDTSYTFYK